MKKKITLFVFYILFFTSIPNILGATTGNPISLNNILNRAIISETNVEISNDFQEVIDQQQIVDCGYGCPFFKNYWLAQGFTPTLETLTRVELELFKVNNPSNEITVSIRDSLTGSDLTSITIDGSIIPPYGQWINFDFSDISVVPDNKYYIVIRTPGGSLIDYYCVLFEINNPYSSGNTWGSLNSGGTWSPVNIEGYPEPDGCFKTYSLDEVPDKPTISGPQSGKVQDEQTFTISTTDPENHDVYYFIDWEDGTNSGWIGPYDSGVDIEVSHSWAEKKVYVIEVKSKDTYGAESDWASFEITIPKYHNLEFKPEILNFLLNEFQNIFSFIYTKFI